MLRITRCLLLLFLIPVAKLAAEEPVDYLKQVKPLLKERCFACHGALKQEAGLRLDAISLIELGGDSGEVLKKGDQVAESLLLQRVSETDVSQRMPPEHEGEPLNAGQISLLRRWMEEGAHAPEDEQPEPDPRDHWAFRPVEPQTVPIVQNKAWVRNPIDAFIAARHEELGLAPQPEASRLILLRRLYLDLIGLPPTEEEIKTCLSQTSTGWYEETVDQLLQDPRYGERWGRHWMDNWRYSDWWGLGQQLRNSQRHIWHWRDWIIDSLNNDMPYDEMVRLMLAADEIAPDDMDRLQASGYLARDFYLFNRNQWLEGTVEHTGKAFLGLTFNCAKCHDHKFDPIAQDDFYKFRAFFEPYQVRMDLVPGERDLERDGIPQVFDGNPETPTWKFIRGDDSKPDKSRAIAPGVPDVLHFDDLQIQTVSLPETAWNPIRREGILKTYLDGAQHDLDDCNQKLHAAETVLESVQKTVREQLAKDQEAGRLKGPVTFSLQEDFSHLDPSRWQSIYGDWVHFPGRLEQKVDGLQQADLRLAAMIPQDFEARLRFRITGGNRWQSVGLSYGARPAANSKEPAALQHQQMIYVSANVGGSKVQGAFQEGGAWHYPAEAAHSQPVELEQEYLLVVRARGELVNASLNGEPVIVWRMARLMPRELIQISTFDATASFYEFTIASLDPQVALAGPERGATPLEEAEKKLQTARWARDESQMVLASVQSRAAAMRALWEEPANVEQANELRIAAVRAERAVTLQLRQHALEKAEAAARGAAGPDSKKVAAAQKGVQDAQAALEKAQTEFQGEVKADEKFTPLVGARWTATRFLSTTADDPEVSFPRQSTGRRTALANWITDRRNPLTARVAVNHIWNRHLGEPLVASTFDFGRNGARPTHPALLDWLANEFVDHGWSMKHLHRLIVTSSTYRMTSSTAGGEASLAKDPENRGWWRRVPIRLESQVVRDSLLSLAGTLDPSIGGPPVMPAQQESSHRRSLYFFHSNNERNLFLTTFDEASVSECYRREQSIVPQQALALSNSGLVLDSTSLIAERIWAGVGDDTRFVQEAFRALTGIEPGDREIQISLRALQAWQELPDATAAQARASFVWTLVNHNDFVTLR